MTEPLGRPEIRFAPPPASRRRIAATERGNERERVLAGAGEAQGVKRDVEAGRVHAGPKRVIERFGQVRLELEDERTRVTAASFINGHLQPIPIELLDAVDVTKAPVTTVFLLFGEIDELFVIHDEGSLAAAALLLVLREGAEQAFAAKRRHHRRQDRPTHAIQ